MNEYNITGISRSGNRHNWLYSVHGKRSFSAVKPVACIRHQSICNVEGMGLSLNPADGDRLLKS